MVTNKLIVDFIDDFNKNYWSITLGSDDEVLINDTWYKEDELLVGLSLTKPFFGCYTWADLEILHYQILLLKCFDKLQPNSTSTDLPINYREPFSTFRFLASAVAKMSKINGIEGFDNLIIARRSESKISIDFKKTFNFDFSTFNPVLNNKPIPVQKEQPVFSIVIDNTK
jgi:hypothetical protein